MITRRAILRSAALLPARILPRLGAQQDPLEALSENQELLQGSLRLDREEYFMGESMRVTVRVLNPTNRALLVPAPVNLNTGRFEVSRRLGDGTVEPLTQRDTYGLPQLTERTPTYTFSAGSEVTRTFWSHDIWPGFDSPMVELGSAPGEPGPYVLGYPYAGASANFRVVRPVLEALAETPVRRVYVIPAEDTVDGQPETIPLFRFAFVLRHNNESHLCVPFGDAEDEFLHPEGIGSVLWDGAVNSIAPFRRIATNPAATRSIEIRETALEQLEVIWTDINGSSRVFLLNHATLDPV